MPKRRGFRFHYFAPKSTHRKPQYIVVDSFVKRYIVLNIVSLDSGSVLIGPPIFIFLKSYNSAPTKTAFGDS